MLVVMVFGLVVKWDSKTFVLASILLLLGKFLYPEGAFAPPFLFLRVLLGLSSWVERDAIELRCS